MLLPIESKSIPHFSPKSFPFFIHVSPCSFLTCHDNQLDTICCNFCIKYNLLQIEFAKSSAMDISALHMLTNTSVEILFLYVLTNANILFSKRHITQKPLSINTMLSYLCHWSTECTHGNRSLDSAAQAKNWRCFFWIIHASFLFEIPCSPRLPSKTAVYLVHTGPRCFE